MTGVRYYSVVVTKTALLKDEGSTRAVSLPADPTNWFFSQTIVRPQYAQGKDTNDQPNDH
jgi:hypothetical protein